MDFHAFTWYERFVCPECKRHIRTHPGGNLVLHGPVKQRCRGSGLVPELRHLSDPAGAYAANHTPSAYDGPVDCDTVEMLLKEAFEAGVDWARETDPA
jgi:hypothetical protein